MRKMNQLKHLMGIPIILPNGLALRGSTFSRSAGSNRRNPQMSGKLLVVTGDNDDSSEPKLSSKSYAKIIEDYCKAIEARNAAAKLNGESKTSKNRFFSKAPFQRLARVSSLVNIKNNANNGESNLCTESSCRPPPNSVETSHKSRKSKGGIDETQTLNQVNKRADWLDHVVKAHNVKKVTQNDNFANDYVHGKNKAHNLVQKPPESRVTRNATRSSFNDSCSSSVKKFPATSASDANNMSKITKTGKKMLKSMSDTKVHHSLSVKRIPDNSATDVNNRSKRRELENTVSKSMSNKSVHHNSSSKKLPDYSESDVNNMSKRTKMGNIITKSTSNTSVGQNLVVKKLPNNSTSDVNNMSKKNKSRNIITKSTSNTSVHKNLAVKKLPDNSTSDVHNMSKKRNSGNIITKNTSNTSVHQNFDVKKLPDNSTSDANNMPKKRKLGNMITKRTSNTSVHQNLAVKKLPDNLTSDVNNTSKKRKSEKAITKSMSEKSVHQNMSVKKIPDNSGRDINNTSKRSKTRNAILKSMSDKSVHHSLSVNKLRDNSAKDANIVSSKSSTTGNSNPKSSSNPIDRYCSSEEKMSHTSASNVKTIPIVVQRLKKTDKIPTHNSSGDTNISSSKSSTSGNINQQNLNNPVDRHYSSVEKQSDPSTSDVKNISVIVQRLPKTDKAPELLTQNSQDGNMMLVTVTENSKSSSTSKSSPLRHINLRINGKPAAEVDSVISKVDKLGVVSSAEKIEITIPVLSKGEEAVGDKLRAPISTINLCISNQVKESTGTNKVGNISRAGERIDCKSGRSKSCLARPSTLITSTMKNSRRPSSSTYRSKVIPWWTNAESFRRSEIVSTRSTKLATDISNVVTKMSDVEKSNARINQEVHDQKPKKVAYSNAQKAPNFVVAKPSSSRQQLYKRKRASVISKIIANETQKKMEREEQERQIRKQLALERLKSYAKPEAKTSIKVKSTASNVPRKEIPSEAIDSTMPGKSVPTSTEAPDEVSKQNTSLPKSTVIGPKLITVELEPDKGLNIIRNNNVSNPNNIQGRIHTKPISELVRGKLKASKRGKTSSAKQVSEGKTSNANAVSKIGIKLRQEVTTKSETNPAPQFPRTYGKIKLLPPSQSLAKPVNRENNSLSSEPVKPRERTTSTDGKLSKLKNATITMKPIEKKKDGTLIDYGVTMNTRKKPERKLSGFESTAGLQGKKLMGQKEAVVVATVKEVMPKRNRDTRSDTINPRGIEDSAKARMHGLDKNIRPSETRISPGKPKNTDSKGTANEVNESANSKTPVKTEKKDSKDSNESPVIETASTDKKLVYSVWLRQFKERTGQDPDPTKDPTSRKP